MDSTIKQILGFTKQWETTIIAIISFFLVFLFTYTAVSKLLELELFHTTLRNIPLFGSEISASIASYIIPIAELLVAFLVGYSKTREAGFLGALILLLIFLVYVLYILFFAPSVPCSCGGITELLTWRQQLYFNIGTILLVLLGLKTHSQRKNNI